MTMRFPSIEVVTSALCVARDHEDWTFVARHAEDTEEPPCLDVRLQVSVGPSGPVWDLRFGDSQYDTNHRGYWGASCIHERMTKREAREIARDLIAQCKDHRAEEAI